MHNNMYGNQAAQQMTVLVSRLDTMVTAHDSFQNQKRSKAEDLHYFALHQQKDEPEKHLFFPLKKQYQSNEGLFLGSAFK